MTVIVRSTNSGQVLNKSLSMQSLCSRVVLALSLTVLSSADRGRQLSKTEEAPEVSVTIGRSLVFLGIGTQFDGRCRRRLLLERRSRRMKRKVTRKVITARSSAAPTIRQTVWM